MGKRQRKNIVIGVVVAILLIALSGVTGWLLADRNNSRIAYPLLDPNVVNSRIQQNIISFDPLRQDIKAYLTSLNLSHSFYFEYLANGVSIRDGEDQGSVAASLMKTPVVMDLYKLGEEKKLNLDDTVAIQQSDISTDNEYGNPSALAVGNTISLRNAAKLALHDSDNTAITVIKRVVTPMVTDSTDAIQSLDISYTLSGTDPTDKVLKISARSYSSILKCLYYSCFLEPRDSQQLLEYLTNSVIQTRIEAGVPKDVGVAHKVGSGIKAQSDCGIVYQPGKPYLICLMFWNYPNTNGGETDGYFKKVSQMVSNYVIKAGN
jgi:beta-lactamase class A